MSSFIVSINFFLVLSPGLLSAIVNLSILLSIDSVCSSSNHLKVTSPTFHQLIFNMLCVISLIFPVLISHPLYPDHCQRETLTFSSLQLPALPFLLFLCATESKPHNSICYCSFFTHFISSFFAQHSKPLVPHSGQIRHGQFHVSASVITLSKSLQQSRSIPPVVGWKPSVTFCKFGPYRMASLIALNRHVIFHTHLTLNNSTFSLAKIQIFMDGINVQRSDWAFPLLKLGHSRLEDAIIMLSCTMVYWNTIVKLANQIVYFPSFEVLYKNFKLNITKLCLKEWMKEADLHIQSQ